MCVTDLIEKMLCWTQCLLCVAWDMSSMHNALCTLWITWAISSMCEAWCPICRTGNMSSMHDIKRPLCAAWGILSMHDAQCPLCVAWGICSKRDLRMYVRRAQLTTLAPNNHETWNHFLQCSGSPSLLSENQGDPSEWSLRSSSESEHLPLLLTYLQSEVRHSPLHKVIFHLQIVDCKCS